MKHLDLSQFHGTSQWYRFSPLTNALLTDGTMYVAQQTDSFGLMQDIAIDCKRPNIRKALEEMGPILVQIDTDGKGLVFKDGNYKELLSYPLYGYQSLKIDLFVGLMEDGVPCIMLKSEY